MQELPQALPLEQVLQHACTGVGIGVQGIGGLSGTMNPVANKIATTAASVFIALPPKMLEHYGGGCSKCRIQWSVIVIDGVSFCNEPVVYLLGAHVDFR